MLKYLLDTHIVIYTIKNRPAKVREAFNRHIGQMCISAVTWGELVYGVEHSSQPEQNRAVIEGMAARMEVLPLEMQDTDHFGQIRAELKQRGTPIGPYDMMIAGQARARGLILVSNNLREFERVDGLRLENWVD
ncbi:MAG: tRNA(fMet)-specific endonuclease VapC [gamma proteobacterium symbiont of Bathyaustriella thionipta]|nr:tRNA(fMet)-specific endonuclease VapC [gamma proteobacterium symbiont of Bathyaustriella thionipta]